MFAFPVYDANGRDLACFYDRADAEAFARACNGAIWARTWRANEYCDVGAPVPAIPTAKPRLPSYASCERRIYVAGNLRDGATYYAFTRDAAIDALLATHNEGDPKPVLTTCKVTTGKPRVGVGAHHIDGETPETVEGMGLTVIADGYHGDQEGGTSWAIVQLSAAHHAYTSAEHDGDWSWLANCVGGFSAEDSHGCEGNPGGYFHHGARVKVYGNKALIRMWCGLDI